MMLDLAETLDPLLNSRLERLENGLEDDEDISETTLQLIFFDGEEAFKDWTDTDSIYGARFAPPLRFIDVRWLINPSQGTSRRNGLRPTSTLTQNDDCSVVPLRQSSRQSSISSSLTSLAHDILWYNRISQKPGGCSTRCSTQRQGSVREDI